MAGARIIAQIIVGFSRGNHDKKTKDEEEKVWGPQCLFMGLETPEIAPIFS
jgi:hypothetical protein